MQRMSDMLTRWLDGNRQQTGDQPDAPQDESSQPDAPQDESSQPDAEQAATSISSEQPQTAREGQSTTVSPREEMSAATHVTQGVLTPAEATDNNNSTVITEVNDTHLCKAVTATTNNEQQTLPSEFQAVDSVYSDKEENESLIPEESTVDHVDSSERDMKCLPVYGLKHQTFTPPANVPSFQSCEKLIHERLSCVPPDAITMPYEVSACCVESAAESITDRGSTKLNNDGGKSKTDRDIACPDRGPSIEAGTDRGPSVEARADRELSVEPITARGSSVETSTDREPSIGARTDREPSIEAITDRGPSVKAVTDRGLSVEAKTAREPSVEASTDREPSVEAKTDREPSVEASTDRVESVEAKTDTVASVEAITDRKSSVEAITDRKPSIEAFTDMESSVSSITGETRDQSISTASDQAIKTVHDIASSADKEPVINLQYNTEGTSASTIQVAFQPCDSSPVSSTISSQQPVSGMSSSQGNSTEVHVNSRQVTVRLQSTTRLSTTQLEESDTDIMQTLPHQLPSSDEVNTCTLHDSAIADISDTLMSDTQSHKSEMDTSDLMSDEHTQFDATKTDAELASSCQENNHQSDSSVTTDLSETTDEKVTIETQILKSPTNITDTAEEEQVVDVEGISSEHQDPQPDVTGKIPGHPIILTSCEMICK